VVGFSKNSYNYNSASSNHVCQSNTQSHHGGAHTQCFSSQVSLALTTRQIAGKYTLALSFIRTTSQLSYWLVSAPRSHHQSHDSASQLAYRQYAKCNVFSSQVPSQLISRTLTRTWYPSILLFAGQILQCAWVFMCEIMFYTFNCDLKVKVNCSMTFNHTLFAM